MSQRSFVGTSVVGWVAPSSLPRFGRLVEEPHSRRVLAVDVSRHRIVPLTGEPGWQVSGPAGSHIFDGAWHPTRGLLLAFGRSHGRGRWAVLRVADDGEAQEIGVPADVAVTSLCHAGDGELVLGVASLEGPGGDQYGGGIASFSPRNQAFHWLYRPPPNEHFVPSGICWDSGAVVFVHTSRHALMRLSADGDLRCVIGRFGRPDSDVRSLNNPTGVSARDGHYVVTDSGNHRVLLVSREGDVVGSFGGGAEGVNLIDPRHAVGRDGSVYVADLGARSVVELRADRGTPRERWGGSGAVGLVLSRPRSIERAATGELVIADTNNNRIVGVAAGGDVCWQIRTVIGRDGRQQPLRWPRSARVAARGRLVVADGLNSRVLVLDRDGAVEHEFDRVRLGAEVFVLADPHDGRWIGEDELLVADSAAGLVTRVRCDGVAAWVVTGLRDPHQAALFHDRVVIVDPELDVVVLVDAASGAELWRGGEFPDAAGRRYRLSKPRVVRASADRLLLVDEAGQVIALGEDLLVRWGWDGRVAWADGRRADFELLEAPRDVLADGADRILLSDYRRNCVLGLEAVE